MIAPVSVATGRLERFSVAEDFAPAYRRDGYVVLTDLFELDDLVRARDEVFDLFRTGLGQSEGGLRTIGARYGDRERWRRCARRTWDLLGVHRLAALPTLAEVLRRVGLEAPMISTRPEVRIDLPEDARYMQPWHQDWRYGQGSVNSVTIWVPLHRVDRSNGTIDVAPGSHLLGYLETEELHDPRRFSIVDPRVEEFRAVAAELELGEAVVFSQLLAHRSGHNTSELPRLTTQIRFTDYAEPRFVENGFPAPSGSELEWDRPPSADEARRLFVG